MIAQLGWNPFVMSATAAAAGAPGAMPNIGPLVDPGIPEKNDLFIPPKATTGINPIYLGIGALVAVLILKKVLS